MYKNKGEKKQCIDIFRESNPNPKPGVLRWADTLNLNSFGSLIDLCL